MEKEHLLNALRPELQQILEMELSLGNELLDVESIEERPSKSHIEVTLRQKLHFQEVYNRLNDSVKYYEFITHDLSEEGYLAFASYDRIKYHCNYTVEELISPNLLPIYKLETETYFNELHMAGKGKRSKDNHNPPFGFSMRYALHNDAIKEQIPLDKIEYTREINKDSHYGADESYKCKETNHSIGADPTRKMPYHQAKDLGII